MKRLKTDYLAAYNRKDGVPCEYQRIEAKNDIDAKKKASLMFRNERGGEIILVRGSSEYALAWKPCGYRWIDKN